IKAGIAAMLFVVLLAAQAYANIGDMQAVPRDWTNFPDGVVQFTVKEGIPVRYHFNGGVYKHWDGNTYTDYIEERTDKFGKLSNYYLYAPKKSGSVFIGWSRVKDVMDKESACFFDTVYEQKASLAQQIGNAIPPIDLYAYWAEDKYASGCYIVKFFPTGGGKVEPVFLHTNEEGKLPYYPIPEKEGYRFKCWSHSMGVEYIPDENTVYKNDTTLYAHWEDENANKIKISFNPNGGTVQPTEMMIEKGSKIQPMPVPEREGYEFKFWSNTLSEFVEEYHGDGIMDENTVFNYDTTLFAHWKKSEGKWEKINAQWSYIKEGSFIRSIWTEINGSWYYFDENAKMRTGWFNQEGNWYYLSEKADANQGKMLTGWQQINGSWYYFYPNSSAGKPAGSMASNTSIEGWRLDSSGKWNP
ncbi:MAG: InlB B-repeat-containing protein, partial [Johnsonella sp.]|nr:InlB B-repeat-containing protein [Johnsonella sp.]